MNIFVIFMRFFVNKLIWTEWWELESVAATDMQTWVSQLWCYRYALCHHYVTGLSHASSIGWHDSFPFISFREFLRIWIIQLPYSGEHIHPVLKLRLLKTRSCSRLAMPRNIPVRSNDERNKWLGELYLTVLFLKISSDRP